MLRGLFSSKEVIKPGFHPIDIPETPVRETTPEEVEAVIRLQAGIRSLRARRQAKGLREARVQRAAATSIQALMRGGLARKQLPRLRKEALELQAQ